MDISPEDFRRHYQSLSDEALLEIKPDELVAVARSCHEDEVSRRGLVEPPPEPVPAPEAPDAHTPEERTCIVEYDNPEEADAARGLLESAEILASVEHEPGVSRLMVPADMANQALQLLIAPLSDEELAAQAEAAGEFEDEEEAAEEPEDADEAYEADETPGE